MELVIISVSAMVSTFFAFLSGLHYGSKIKNNEPININPVRMAKEHKEIKRIEDKLDREQQIEEINLANIDSYDGTELGQLDFPKE